MPSPKFCGAVNESEHIRQVAREDFAIGSVLHGLFSSLNICGASDNSDAHMRHRRNRQTVRADFAIG